MSSSTPNEWFILDWNTIIGYEWTKKTIKIPYKINGKVIRTIGKWAFENKWIKDITLPEWLLNIEENAFKDNSITKVILNDGIQSIWAHAFENNAIIIVDFPETLKEINDFAFYGCSIKELVLPKKVKNIWKYAFYLNNIKKLDFNLNTWITSIGKCAFASNQIKSVIFPTSSIIREIEEGVFMENKINELILPKHLLWIRTYAFYWNPIKKINSGNTIQYIEDFAFDLDVKQPTVSSKVVEDSYFSEEKIKKEKKFVFFGRKKI